jgi:hypothetical protein
MASGAALSRGPLRQAILGCGQAEGMTITQLTSEETITGNVHHGQKTEPLRRKPSCSFFNTLWFILPESYANSSTPGGNGVSFELNPVSFISIQQEGGGKVK